MQERHNNRKRYFQELAATSANHFIPYIRRFHAVAPGTRVLEIGCGEGGNLLPFSWMRCDVTGVDMAPNRIDEARRFFAESQAKGRFFAADFLHWKGDEHKYDIVICHDVLEHIADKRGFLLRVGRFLDVGGIVFMSFPAWQMPFGGHQQICRGRILSHAPFVHLLPAAWYDAAIRWSGEDEATRRELLSIRQTRITIGAFEHLAQQAGYEMADRTLYLVNPHYQVKFGLTPRLLPRPLSDIPHLRNFLSTSCFYLLLKN